MSADLIVYEVDQTQFYKWYSATIDINEFELESEYILPIVDIKDFACILFEIHIKVFTDYTSCRAHISKSLGESFQVNVREMSKLKTTRISLASLMW